MFTNARHEGPLSRLFVKAVVDPVFGSRFIRNRLRTAVKGQSSWVGAVVRNLIDPTLLPPLMYTRARADRVYGEAFRRCIEFTLGSNVPGDVLEFGTLCGYTARWWAGLLKDSDRDSKLFLFDSFEGLPAIEGPVDRQLPEVKEGRWYQGSMKVADGIERRIEGALTRFFPRDRLRVVKGYFQDTLPANLPDRPVAVLHIDADLYESARYVLDTLLDRDLLQDGTIIAFDDYNTCRANPAYGERLAIVDSFRRQSRFTFSPWFSYGWHGQTLFVHDTTVTA